MAVILILIFFAYLSFLKFRKKLVRKEWAKNELENWKSPEKSKNPVEEYKRKMRAYLSPQAEVRNRRIRRMLTLKRPWKKRREDIIVLGGKGNVQKKQKKKEESGGLFNMFD